MYGLPQHQVLPCRCFTFHKIKSQQCTEQDSGKFYLTTQKSSTHQQHCKLTIFCFSSLPSSKNKLPEGSDMEKESCAYPCWVRGQGKVDQPKVGKKIGKRNTGIMLPCGGLHTAHRQCRTGGTHAEENSTINRV